MNVYKRVLDYLALYQKPAEKPIRRKVPPKPHLMKIGRAYRGKGWALCKFAPLGLHGEDEQQAFNAVAACVPKKLRMLPWHKGGADWSFIPAGMTDKSDPLGQCGYWGAKWESRHKQEGT